MPCHGTVASYILVERQVQPKVPQGVVQHQVHSPACSKIGWSNRNVGAKYLVAVFAENKHELSTKLKLPACKWIWLLLWWAAAVGQTAVSGAGSAMIACGRKWGKKWGTGWIMSPLSWPGHGIGDTGATHCTRDRPRTCAMSVCRLLVQRPLSCAGQVLSLMVRRG